MPQRGLTSKWERENNRTFIFRTLLKKSLSFTELLKETGFSRSTLSQHIKDLLKEKVIEKAIMKGKVVYRITLDELRLISELKRANFDLVLSYLRVIDPDMANLIELFIKIQVKITIFNKIREVEGKRNKDDDKLVKQIVPLLQEFDTTIDNVKMQNEAAEKLFGKLPTVPEEFAKKMKLKGLSVSIEETERGGE